MAQTLYDGVHETCIAYVAKATKSLSKHTMAGGKVNVNCGKYANPHRHTNDKIGYKLTITIA